MPVPLLQRLSTLFEPSGFESVANPAPLAVVDRPALTAGGISLQAMQKALGKPITPKRDDGSGVEDDWKGVDWDEEAASMFYSGERPNQGHPGANWLHFSTLKSAAEMSICAPFIMKRVQQMMEFSRPQANKYTFGCKFKLRDNKAMTPAAEREIRELWKVFNRYEPFHQTMQKWSNDSWPYDQAAGEVVYEKGNRPYAFRALDAATMRRSRPKRVERKDGGRDGAYDGAAQTRFVSDGYVQIMRDRIQRSWDKEEILWFVRRQRSSIYTFGYGYPEIQQAYDALVAYINADNYNQYYFKNGTHASSILQVRSKMNRQAWNAFKMVMTAQLKGIENAHRMAMVLLDPGGTEAAKESIEKVDLARNNREMEFTKLILMKIMIIAANFNMSPKEAGLPEYSDGGSKMGNENPKEQIELSKKFGLMPALMAFEDVLNEGIVYKYDEDFEFKFVYDDETEAQRLDLAQKAIQGGVDSINGQRKELDKPIIDRKFIKSLGLKTITDETIDGLVLSYNLPFTPTLMQAIGQLTPQAPEEGQGGPGGPGGEGGQDDQGDGSGDQGDGGDDGFGDDSDDDGASPYGGSDDDGGGDSGGGGSSASASSRYDGASSGGGDDVPRFDKPPSSRFDQPSSGGDVPRFDKPPGGGRPEQIPRQIPRFDAEPTAPSGGPVEPEPGTARLPRFDAPPDTADTGPAKPGTARLPRFDALQYEPSASKPSTPPLPRFDAPPKGAGTSPSDRPGVKRLPRFDEPDEMTTGFRIGR